MQKHCSVPGCDSKHYQAGFCSSHYYRNRRHGSPTAGDAKKGELMQWLVDHVNYKENDCINWPFAKAKSGYGRVKFNGKYTVASRAMCILAHGEPPSERYDAAHSCGNGHKGCMNPNHLSWKTRAENNKDKIGHGTHRQGEKINFAKLTNIQALEVIEKARFGKTHSDISQEYGVTRYAVKRIVSGERWAHLSRLP